MPTLARDIMQKDVVTVSPELPLLATHRLFISEEIHGAPVVDDAGNVVGVISSADLLRTVAEEHGEGSMAVNYLRDLVEFSGPDWAGIPEDFQDRLADLCVEDAMTPDTVQVSPDASLSEVAGALCDNRVHRVLVSSEGKLVGLISTMDLVAMLRDDASRGRRSA